MDGTWPDTRLLLLPAPLASTTNSLLHVRTSYWRGAERFVTGGGVLYLSCSAEVAIPEMDELAFPSIEKEGVVLRWGRAALRALLGLRFGKR